MNLEIAKHEIKELRQQVKSLSKLLDDVATQKLITEHVELKSKLNNLQTANFILEKQRTSLLEKLNQIQMIIDSAPRTKIIV